MNAFKLFTGLLIVLSMASCSTTSNSIVSTDTVKPDTQKVSNTGPSANYYSAMEENIKKLESSDRSVEKFKNLCATFERIGNTEKDQWQPLYYASLSYTYLAYVEKDLNKVDEWGDKAEITLAQMLERDPVQSEVLVLKAMIAYSRIKVNFMARGMEYSVKAKQYLEEAEALKDNNPRVYVLLAQSYFKAPPQFGRDVKKGCQLNRIALDLLEAERKAEAASGKYNINPHWGSDDAVRNRNYCR
jgi:predicted Zn-dependent protease